MTRAELEQVHHVPSQLEAVLAAIEAFCGDDFAADVECQLVFHPANMAPQERELAKRLGEIFAITHGFNTAHSCYHVHGPWRQGAFGVRP